jgi:hypothetical protein
VSLVNSQNSKSSLMRRIISSRVINTILKLLTSSVLKQLTGSKQKTEKNNIMGLKGAGLHNQAYGGE